MLKKTHLIAVSIYLIFVFIVLGLILQLGELVPSVPVDIQKGGIDLTDFDFKNSIAYASGEVEFYFDKLLDPDQLDEYVPDGYHFDAASKYTTARIRFFVTDGDYMIFGESPEYASRIYINGELMDTFGQIDDKGNIYRVAPFELPARPQGGVIELVTHSVSLIRDDPTYYGFYFGEQKTAKYYQLCNMAYQLIPIGIFITCALFYLGFFMFTPGDKINLWFALISLMLGVRTAASGGKILLALIPCLDYRFAFLTENGTLILVSVFYVLFARALFKEIIPKRFVTITCAVNAALMILLISLPIRMSANYLIINMIVLFAIMGISIVCIIIEARQLKEEQIISFAGQVIFMLCGVSDLLNARFDVKLLPFISYNANAVGMLLFTFAQMAALFLYNNKVFENERRLVMEKAALERINNLKTEFLGNISHELKTPLTVVSNYAQLTRRHAEQAEHEDEYTVRKMKLVTSEAERMALMVDQLLEFARLENPEVEYHFAPVDVPALIRYTVDTYYPVLNKNRNTLDMALPDMLPEVWADGGRIVQVLVNLVSNSVKFSKNGRITLGARLLVDQGKVEIYVKDTGQGMDESRLAHIFERFYTNGGDVYSGTGLGLHICMEIIKAHDGEINIWSRPGEGTTVYFSLKATGEGERQIETNNTVD